MVVRCALVVEVGGRPTDKDPYGAEAGCQPHHFASTSYWKLEHARCGHVVSASDLVFEESPRSTVVAKRDAV